MRVSQSIPRTNKQGLIGHFEEEQEQDIHLGNQTQVPPALTLDASGASDGANEGFKPSGEAPPSSPSIPPALPFSQSTTIDFLPPPQKAKAGKYKGPPTNSKSMGRSLSPPNRNLKASKASKFNRNHRQQSAHQSFFQMQRREGQMEKEKLEIIAINIKRIHRFYPFVIEHKIAHKMLKNVLRKQALRWLSKYGPDGQNSRKRRWNNRFQNFPAIQLPKDLDSPKSKKRSRTMLKGQKGNNKAQALENWYGRAMKTKKMNPQRKFSELLAEILPAKNWTEDMEVALKALFGHTANFHSSSGIGRDHLNSDHGEYYRSSLENLRKKSVATYKNILEYVGKHKHQKGETYQAYNRALIDLLTETANLDQRIRDSKYIYVGNNKAMGVSILKVNKGMETGSLGLLSNVYHTLRVASKLLSPLIPLEEEIQNKPTFESEKGLIPEEKLKIGGNEIYRDEMLKDRGNLVRQVSSEILKSYVNPSQGKTKIIPIQNDGHPSLILGLKSPDPSKKIAQPTEKEFREGFITYFNEAAAERRSQIQLTHRGSFGFPFPTASSVGTPIRVWPGLAPYRVFKPLVFAALEKTTQKGIHINEERTKDEEKDKKKTKVKFQYIKDVDFEPMDFKGASLKGPGSTIHISGLKTAVRYVQSIIGKKMTLNGPKKAFDWTMTRLRKNLLKADWVLQMAEKGDANSEPNYLKAISTMENLMEYGFLLESILHSPEAEEQKDDPYAAYFQQTMGIDQPDQHRADLQNITFYLDSGMQAIVCANVLARQFHEPENSEIDLETIDLYSYFEYGAVDYKRMRLDAINRRNVKEKADEGSGYVGVNFLEETIERFINRNASPAIIAADLNPVFVDEATKKNKVDYDWVFDIFKEDSPYLNDFTIPILDVTNASLEKAAELQLHKGYENFIIVESLSKHQQLGADKFTMGRLTAVGNSKFIQLAKDIVAPTAEAAHDRLPMMMALRMDRIFYGGQNAIQEDVEMEEAIEPQQQPDLGLDQEPEVDHGANTHNQGTKRPLLDQKENPKPVKRPRNNPEKDANTISVDDQMLLDQVDQFLHAPTPAPKTEQKSHEEEDLLQGDAFFEDNACLLGQTQNFKASHTLEEMESWL